MSAEAGTARTAPEAAADVPEEADFTRLDELRSQLAASYAGPGVSVPGTTPAERTAAAERSCPAERTVVARLLLGELGRHLRAGRLLDRDILEQSTG